MLDLILVETFVYLVSGVLIAIGKAFKTKEVADFGKIIFVVYSVFMLSIELIGYNKYERKIKEKTVIDYVEGTITYDTLTMDKNSKILTIKLIEKE